MQNPTAPTFDDVTAACPSRKSTAPARSWAALSTGSSDISAPASSESWVVAPPNRSGASATKPSAANRSVTSLMWVVRPHHSWMTTSPGPLPDSGTAREPWAVPPLLGKVTFCTGFSVTTTFEHARNSATRRARSGPMCTPGRSQGDIPPARSGDVIFRTFREEVVRANVPAVSVIVPVADHVAAAADLVRRYRELPPEARVRLGKPSSNLFRFGAPPPTLDASGLSGVIAVDPVARTADVAGMTTYEDLVDATLRYGLMPLVVPQLKTITLGGAVAGLGIESTSFRHGLPHESVREMEVLTGSGEVVTATPDGEHADLYRGFPNSYGTLGYALRLVIDLQPVRPYVRLRHRRYPDAAACTAALTELAGPGVSESHFHATTFQ